MSKAMLAKQVESNDGILTKSSYYSPMIQKALDNVVLAVQGKLNVPDVAIALLENKELLLVSNMDECDKTVALTKQLCAQTIELNDTLSIENICADEVCVNSDTLNESSKMSGFIGIPIRKENKAVGALHLFTDKIADFTEEEIAFLHTKADAVSIALSAANFSHQFMIEHNLLSKGPISSLIIDSKPGWPTVFVSANCYNLLGLSANTNEQLFRIDDFIHPDHKTIFKRSLTFHRSTQIQDLETEYDVVLPSGEYKSIRQVSYGEYSEAGKLIYVRLYLIDQTSQKELEVRLRKVKERSSLIIETLDLDGVVYPPASNNIHLFPNFITGQSSFI